MGKVIHTKDGRTLMKGPDGRWMSAGKTAEKAKETPKKPFRRGHAINQKTPCTVKKAEKKIDITNITSAKNVADLHAKLQERGLTMDPAHADAIKRGDRKSLYDGEKVSLYDKDGNEYRGTFNKYFDGGTEIVNIKKTGSKKSAEQKDSFSMANLYGEAYNSARRQLEKEYGTEDVSKIERRAEQQGRRFNAHGEEIKKTRSDFKTGDGYLTYLKKRSVFGENYNYDALADVDRRMANNKTQKIEDWHGRRSGETEDQWKAREAEKKASIANLKAANTDVKRAAQDEAFKQHGISRDQVVGALKAKGLDTASAERQASSMAVADAKKLVKQKVSTAIGTPAKIAIDVNGEKIKPKSASSGGFYTRGVYDLSNHKLSQNEIDDLIDKMGMTDITWQRPGVGIKGTNTAGDTKDGDELQLGIKFLATNGKKAVSNIRVWKRDGKYTIPGYTGKGSYDSQEEAILAAKKYLKSDYRDWWNHGYIN